MTSHGDVALLCWAAAEARHSELPQALDRLAELDRRADPLHVAAAAWIVSALVAARPHADVEGHLAAARHACWPPAARSTRMPTGGGAPWYRAHVGSFADQVYPVQALARLHASADDPEALAAADGVADAICAAQGEAGQWWWHYDSRIGGVVEGYPVYSVHQHAMAPMALLDLADAGGAGPPGRHLPRAAVAGQAARDRRSLVLDEPPITWRKVARGDRRKAVRGLRAASTRIRPDSAPGALDRFPGRVRRSRMPAVRAGLAALCVAAAACGPGGDGTRCRPRLARARTCSGISASIAFTMAQAVSRAPRPWSRESTCPSGW